MITKRGFLTGAASAAVAATASRGAWAANPAGAIATSPGGSAASAQHCAPAFDAVVFNERYSDARAFAQALAAAGVPALAMAGDAGALWHGALRKRVAGGYRRVAGVGTSMDLLILESLGGEAGLKVRFLAQHDCRGSRTLTHAIAGESAAYGSLAEELAAPDWPVRLAAALPRLAEQACAGQAVSVATAAGLRVATTVERSHDHPGMLFSWILGHRAGALPQDPS
ncbi:MAG TPA: hypothetical protein VN750_05805 [Steroidobacteraceae bacterium]|nr:hypothetical protein [Steroidobacteraceae bacterium]